VVNPTSSKGAREYTDRRVAANFVWYPQPFGIEAEWTYGEGPETVNDTDADGKFITKSSYRVDQEQLHGGYVLLNYKLETDLGTVIPFTRWNYFDGARKFQNNSSQTSTANLTTGAVTAATNSANNYLNSPTQKVNELDIGVEYQPWPCFEVALVYSRAFWRTNTSNANLAKDVDRVTCQLQYNF
jgi:hypothetical protein